MVPEWAPLVDISEDDKDWGVALKPGRYEYRFFASVGNSDPPRRAACARNEYGRKPILSHPRSVNNRRRAQKQISININNQFTTNNS